MNYDIILTEDARSQRRVKKLNLNLINIASQELATVSLYQWVRYDVRKVLKKYVKNFREHHQQQFCVLLRLLLQFSI